VTVPTYYEGVLVDPAPGQYYVSVWDHAIGDFRRGRQGFLLGPFCSHLEALERVDQARAEAGRVNDRASWYAYGTLKMPKDYDKPGILNYLLAQPFTPKPKRAPVPLPNRKIPLGEEKRLLLDPSRPYDACTNTIQRRTWRVVGHPSSRELGHCIYVQPVGCDGFKTEPKLLAMRFWERDEE
jgi:hypothetical protein